MIAAWMAYLTVVGAFAGISAWILERLLRSHRRPARWVWLGSLAISVLWPAWAAFRPAQVAPPAGPGPGMPVTVLEPLALQVGTQSVWVLLDRPLLWTWLLASTVLLGLGAVLGARTRFLRRRWREAEAGGRAVLFSEDWGPAVVGLFRPRVVLPAWCRTMGREELRLILDHETEHLRAGDLRLLALATAFPILVPWSLPIWWMWSRLRLATEGDCDLRVLRRNPRSTRTYLELLLEVGRRLPQQGAVAAKLTQAEKSLEWRIRTMTMPMPRKPWLRGTLLLGSGALLIGVACAMPTPLAMEEEQELPAVHAVATRLHGDLSETARLAMEGPTFTPFTVRPEITNREAVARAMEAEYPPLLREAGIGGTASVWFFLDEAGAVQRVLLNTSSGHQALDQAAVRVARQIEFTPALEGDQRVPVWIALPITFTVR